MISERIFTPALYAFEERELILDIFEAASGSRMMCNYHRFGGVSRDLPDGVLEKIKGLVEERLPRKADEFDRFLTENEISALAHERPQSDQRGRCSQVFDHRPGITRRRRSV